MSQHIKSVQALRGLACLAVVTFHYRYMLDSHYPALKEMLSHGAIGVDLFFILSGFVITLTVSRMGTGIYAAGEFLKRRALRLLPAYFILLLINFLLSGAMATFHYEDKTQALISALTLSVYMPDHAPFYVDDSGFLGVRWTLNYEFLFYLMMAVCLLVRARWAALTSMLVVVLVALPLFTGYQPTLQVAGYNTGYAYINLMTNPIIWQFAAGVFIGLVYPHLVKLPVVTRGAFLLATVILFVLHINCGEQINYGQHIGHGMMGSGTVLALLFAGVAINDSWLSRITPRWLIFIGDISFSVYLVHIVTKDRLSKYFADEGMAFFASSLLLAILLGWLSYCYIEPVGQKVMRRQSRKRVERVEVTG